MLVALAHLDAGLGPGIFGHEDRIGDAGKNGAGADAVTDSAAHQFVVGRPEQRGSDTDGVWFFDSCCHAELMAQRKTDVQHNFAQFCTNRLPPSAEPLLCAR